MFVCQEGDLDDKQAALVLQNCSFSRQTFNGNQQSSLENISLLIRKGEFVGLLGGMGSGKSTLASLINFRLFQCKTMMERLIFLDCCLEWRAEKNFWGCKND